MSETRDRILQLGEQLIRRKGYNAFSYHDISTPLEIKNAAVHYYFPKKTDLALGILEEAQKRFDDLWVKHSEDTALAQLQAFIKVYAESSKNDLLCLVGAMAAEFYSLEVPVQKALKASVESIAAKITAILIEGKKRNEFQFEEQPHTRALIIITNLLAGLQLARISGNDAFEVLKGSIIKGITK